MSTGFNLINDDWITFPGAGTHSIRSVFRFGHELPGWPSGEPLFTAALMRILTPITYRVSGLDAATLTVDTHTKLQLDLLSAGKFDPAAVDDYLNRWEKRFWLFGAPGGEEAFAQDPDVDLANAAPADKLVMQRAAGNNPLWGNQHQGRLEPADTARHLLVQLYYSAGGTGAARTGAGRSYLKGARLRDTFSVHPVGRTFAETLLLHAVPIADVPGEFGVGAPFWETEPGSVPAKPSGVLEMIAGRFEKAFSLGVEEGWVTSVSITEPAAGIADTATGVPYVDPYVVHDSTEQPPVRRKPRAGRAVWRELENLGLRSDLGGTSLTPVLRHAELGLVDRAPTGWVVITHRGDKSKDIAWDTSTLPDVTVMFQELERWQCAANFLSYADQLRKQLGVTLKRLWDETRSSGSTPYETADAEFWALAENQFWATTKSYEVSLGPEAPWVRDLVRFAVEAFDVTVDPLRIDPRAQIAIEQHRQRLSNWRPKP